MKTHLLKFIEALRHEGLSVTVAETLDAAHAVGAAGIERRPLREALAATLVKDHDDRPDFDAVFDRFFALETNQSSKNKRRQPSPDGAGTGIGQSVTHTAARPLIQREPHAAERRRPAETPRQAPLRPDARTPAPHAGHQARVLRQTPFQDLSALQIEACETLVSELAHRFRAHLGRRLHVGRPGRLDIRRTLRQSISSGGVPLAPIFRQRRPGRPDLVALCDHSHSVITATNFLTALLMPAQGFFRRVRLFAFVNRPVEVSVDAGMLIPHEPLDLYARSDFGGVLVQFWDRYEPVLTRNTLLLILGDARNNRRPPRADVLAHMRRIVRRVVWLNPDPVGRWNTGDSVIASYQPHCDTVIAASNIKDLYMALQRVVRP